MEKYGILGNPYFRGKSNTDRLCFATDPKIYRYSVNGVQRSKNITLQLLAFLSRCDFHIKRSNKQSNIV